MRLFPLLLSLLLYLPLLSVPPNACGMSRESMVFVDAWLEALGERAPLMRCDERLVIAAQGQADYLTMQIAGQSEDSLHDGKHDSTPNMRVRAAGYHLPEWYGNGNVLESSLRVVGTDVHGVSGLASFLRSPPHRAHIMGEDWFEGHVVYGVGWRGEVLIVIIAPPE